MSISSGRQLNLLCCALAAFLLTGCGGGSKLLKEPIEVELQQPLAQAADENVEAALDWVIVRDGPGTWSKNAWWDEYLLRVANRSDVPVTIESIQVIDSLGTPLSSGDDRKQLVKGSKLTARRYKDADIEVKPGAGTGMLIAVGTGTFVVAGAAAAASIGAGFISALGGTAASTPAIVGVAGTAAVIAAPVLIVGGVVKGVNNSKVNDEIIARRAVLPLELAAGEATSLNVFFPVAPSPRAVQIVYETDGETDVVEIVTGDVLQGLHLDNEATEASGVAAPEASDD